MFSKIDLKEYYMPDFCHVYSAGAWHDAAYIVADTDALIKLKQTIENALESGQSSCALFVNDGEGFDLIVVKVDDPQVKIKMQRPYIDDVAKSDKGLCPSLAVNYEHHRKEKDLRKAQAKQRVEPYSIKNPNAMAH